MLRRAALLFTVVLFLAATAGCTRQPKETPPAPAKAPLVGPTAEKSTGVKTKLRVMVPCGMIIPVKAVIDEFEKANPDVDVDGIYDNPGVLVKKITEKGEKADVFMSPGEMEIGALEKANLVDPSAKVALGSFELVVIVPTGNPLNIQKPEDLKKCKTISTPDPAVNSVGRCAQDALTKLGLWETLQPKMLKTEHAITSHQYVASGKSDAGLAYKNCPLETNPEKLSKSKVAIAFVFDEKDYDKQKCWVAPMKTAQNAAAATKFVEFISSEAGRQLLADKGMTGCMDDLACPMPDSLKNTSASSGGQTAVVEVRAFYPDNEGHAHIKRLIESLPRKYPGKVKAEFVDFTSDEGFKKWQEAGLSCGAILINNEQTWTYEEGGQTKEVTFKMAMGGEWDEKDLHAVIKKLIKENGS